MTHCPSCIQFFCGVCFGSFEERSSPWPRIDVDLALGSYARLLSGLEVEIGIACDDDEQPRHNGQCPESEVSGVHCTENCEATIIQTSWPGSIRRRILSLVPDTIGIQHRSVHIFTARTILTPFPVLCIMHAMRSKMHRCAPETSTVRGRASDYSGGSCPLSFAGCTCPSSVESDMRGPV